MKPHVETPHQIPFYLSHGGEDLFAVLTEPVGTANGTTVMTIPGGAWMPGTNRNRMYVRLSARIAQKGYASMRFDYHGAGESTGRADYYDLDRPHGADVAAAAQYLTKEGHDRLVLVGTCFGARSSVAAVPDIAGLAGIAMIGVPFESDRGAAHSLGWHIRQVFAKSTWTRLREQGRWRQYVRIAGRVVAKSMPWKGKSTPEAGGTATKWFVDAVIGLIDRGVPLLLIYGNEEDYYQGFLRAREGPLGEALARGADLVRVVVAEGEVHGLVSVAAQDLVIDTVAEWLESTVSRTGGNA